MVKGIDSERGRTMSECKTVDFFLGGNTPEGFCSYFDQFDQPKEGMNRYLIKGGPGTGKSRMMKKVLLAAQEQDIPGILERIHCSSDANSLDAVIWKAKGFALFDATAPHVIEPKYPGAYDRIVNITQAFDNQKLAAALTPIVALFKRISALHERCRVFLSAANMLYLQNQYVLSGYLQEEKLKRSSERFAKRLLYGCKGDTYHEELRMLSNVTDQGMVTYDQTVSTLADKIVCVKDSFGLVSTAYLSAVQNQAKKQRLSVILCMSPFHNGKIDHIIFPNERVAVVTADSFMKFPHCPQMQCIRISRYLPPKALHTVKTAVRHRTLMIKALIEDASKSVQQAKILHDKLEGYYTPAVDFEKVNELTQWVIQEMLKK